MTDNRERQGDWDRSQWKGEGQGAGDEVVDRHLDDPLDSTSTDRWTKTQVVGEGQGPAGPDDPDAMAEGESALSGDRHAPGEEHWARGSGDPRR